MNALEFGAGQAPIPKLEPDLRPGRNKPTMQPDSLATNGGTVGVIEAGNRLRGHYNILNVSIILTIPSYKGVSA